MNFIKCNVLPRCKSFFKLYGVKAQKKKKKPPKLYPISLDLLEIPSYYIKFATTNSSVTLI